MERAPAAMKHVPFASADFGEVPPFLTAERPERLLHADVLRGAAAADGKLSQERGHLVRMVDLPSRALSMTLGGLAPGESTRRHRHNYETIIYVVAGAGVSVIEDREVRWRAGDAFYVPTWAWHQHNNLSATESALYVACENAPLLQNLGIALREEA
jgi:quercetin dioxygenase-like cupin family protein